MYYFTSMSHKMRTVRLLSFECGHHLADMSASFCRTTTWLNRRHSNRSNSCRRQQKNSMGHVGWIDVSQRWRGHQKWLTRWDSNLPHTLWCCWNHFLLLSNDIFPFSSAVAFFRESFFFFYKVTMDGSIVFLLIVYLACALCQVKLNWLSFKSASSFYFGCREF